MYTLIQDLRFAFRQLMKAPGFGLTVVRTLALGIGAVTAMISLVEGILLRPLPSWQVDRSGSPGLLDHRRNVAQF